MIIGIKVKDPCAGAWDEAPQRRSFYDTVSPGGSNAWVRARVVKDS